MTTTTIDTFDARTQYYNQRVITSGASSPRPIARAQLSTPISDGFFRFRSPSVVARVIDGEVICIAFETGTYYAASGSAAAIMAALLRETPPSQIAESFATNGHWSRGAIAQSVYEFLNALEQEGLIEPCARSSSAVGVAQVAEPEQKSIEFQRPEFTRYSDLEDLLMLDPIHEVDPMGWPVARADLKHES
jgi:hypothetical protein